MNRRYQLSFSPIMGGTRHEGIVASPSAHDVPRALTVDTDDRSITLAFEYSGGRHEQPVKSSASSAPVEAYTGKFSGRILQIRVDLGQIEALAKNGRDGAQQLLVALRALIQRLETLETLRAEINYRYAERGLGLEEPSAPPAWLIDAMGQSNDRPSKPPSK